MGVLKFQLTSPELASRHLGTPQGRMSRGSTRTPCRLNVELQPKGH